MNYWKTISTGFFIALAIEYGLCVAVAKFQGYENIYEQGGFYLLIIWAIQIALWFKNTAAMTIFYWIWAKNKLATEIADQFSKLGFPAYEDYSGLEDWLGETKYDESLSHDAQLYAAMLEGHIVFCRGQGFQSLFRMIGMIRLAAQKHTRRLPARKFA